MGFFQLDSAPKSRPKSLPSCGACGLYRGCKSPKMPPTGEGKRRMLVVAEAPGKEEDEQGIQLIGDAGKRLRRTLRKYGVDLDRDCWKTNALCCRPPDNRTPTSKEVAACRPNLVRAIQDRRPSVVLLLGGSAIESLIGMSWSNVGTVGRWVGWKIPSQKWNAWICPTYHSSYLLRENDEVLDLHFDRHVESASELEGRPWKQVPDHSKKIQVAIDPDEAALLIQDIHRRGGWLSFDFESNSLKPDAPWSEIVSCAISWEGKYTIAYPWVGDAIAQTSRLLRGRQFKLASNMKHEQRWTVAKLGHPVKNWRHDTMVMAHVLDNRTRRGSGITGLKFQAYVLLGQEPYDGHITPYLEQPDPRKPNRIREVKLERLLLYNGMDALMTCLVAEKQGSLR